MQKAESYKYAEIYGVIRMHVCLLIPGVMARKGCSNTKAALNLRASSELSKNLIYC